MLSLVVYGLASSLCCCHVHVWQWQKAGRSRDELILADPASNVPDQSYGLNIPPLDLVVKQKSGRQKTFDILIPSFLIEKDVLVFF